MIYSRFLSCFLISFLLATTSFLECPQSPSPTSGRPLDLLETPPVDDAGVPMIAKPRRKAICPALAEGLLKLREDKELVVEDFSKACCGLRVDTSKPIGPQRPHLDSDSTVASGRSSVRGSADEVEDGKMTEDLGVAVDGASDEALLKLEDEDREGGVLLTGIEVGRASGIDCVPRRVSVVLQGEFELNIAEKIDEDMACESVVHPLDYGLEKGRLIAAEFSSESTVLMCCLFKCLEYCAGAQAEAKEQGLVITNRWEGAERIKRLRKHFDFWTGVERGFISSLDDPVFFGCEYGKYVFRKIMGMPDRKKAKLAAIVGFLTSCSSKISGYFADLSSKERRKNALFWIMSKVMCTFSTHEAFTNPKKPGTDFSVYSGLGKKDAQDVYSRHFVSVLLAFCSEPIKHFRKSTHKKSVAMLHYWLGFQQGLEECEKRAS